MTANAPALNVEALLGARMFALVGWMRRLGVCGLCAHGIAIATTERECGRNYDWRGQRGECRHHMRGRNVLATCEARVRAAWPERPRKHISLPVSEEVGGHVVL